MSDPGGTKPTKVMLVDDHASFLEPLAFMFEREPDFAVVACTNTLAEARNTLGRLTGGSRGVDVAVVDLDLPDGEGTELIGDLCTVNRHCAVLVLSGISEQARLARAVEAGASGLLHKSTRIKDVVAAARRLAAGEHLLSPAQIHEMRSLAIHQRRRDQGARSLLEQLTRREKEVLQAFGEGLNDQEVATRLYVSPATVRTHMANTLAKLEVDSRLQALLLAARFGVVEIARAE